MSKRKKKHQNVDGGVSTLQPGEKLRRAREARELSVNDVAVRLKLNVEKIATLERGEVEGLATPMFVAGYLRTYARLLDLPEDEVLADFAELLPMQESVVDSMLTANEENYGKVANEIPEQFSLREKSPGNRLAMVVFVSVLILALGYFLWPSDKVTRTTDSTEAANENADPTVSSSETVLPEMSETMAVEADALQKDESQDIAENSVTEAEENSTGGNSAVESNAEAIEPEVNEVVVAVPFDVSETIIEPVADGMKSELILSFNSDSWAEVKDARGQRLVYRLGKLGSTRVVTGVAPFMVQLGYVQGVDIVYNGATFDLSKYANRRSVRLFIGESGDRMGGE